MRNNQSGIAHLALIFMVLLVVAVVGFAGYTVTHKSKTITSTQTPVTQDKEGDKEGDLVLQNIGLQSLNNVLISQNAVREFNSKGLKGFYVFGDKLSGGRINPNFEFASLKPDTKVVSASNGVVTFIKDQSDSGDFEVIVQPKDGSMWTVAYDHLTKLAVKKGDVVKAGDVLGEPATQGNGALRFEIQVNKDENGVTTHICPSTLLANDVKDVVLAELTTMQKSWESTTGLELYDLSVQNPVGCLMKSMSPKEAEGR
jgi:hypothetical protein